jgi:hypothetical protein
MAMCLVPMQKAEEQAKVKMTKAKQSNQTNEAQNSTSYQAPRGANRSLKTSSHILNTHLHNAQWRRKTSPGHYGLAAEGSQALRDHNDHKAGLQRMDTLRVPNLIGNDPHQVYKAQKVKETQQNDDRG